MKKPRTTKILGVSMLHDNLIERARKGLPASAVNELARIAGLTDPQIARAIGVSTRTLARIRTAPANLLGQVESDRALRVARVLDHARGVFEDDAKMVRWLHNPIVALGGKAPVDFLDTDAGLRRVDTILGQIDYGGIA